MADRDTKVLLMIIVTLRRCQKLLFVGAVTIVLSSLLLLSCGDGAGPTASTPLGGDETGTGMEETSLASQIQGTFIGEFQNPSMSQSNYKIIVTKIDDTSVRVAPASGSASSTFVANLESNVSGSVTSITLEAPDDILANNGTFAIVGSVGRLSYAYHLGGSDSGNVEVFSGTKQ